MEKMVKGGLRMMIVWTRVGIFAVKPFLLRPRDFNSSTDNIAAN